jgi:hypothetical protein
MCALKGSDPAGKTRGSKKERIIVARQGAPPYISIREAAAAKVARAHEEDTDMNQVIQAQRVNVVCGALSQECDQAAAMDVAGELLAKTGLTHAALRFEPVGSQMPVSEMNAAAGTSAPVYSEFGGKLVADDVATARIEATHELLKAQGVAVDASKQLYATGTRMAKVGYDMQAQRAAEHAAKLPVMAACEALADRVREEQREDVVVSAHEFARSLTVNGKVKAFGLAITEQAMRGLCSRLESPAIRYLLGMRDRIIDTVGERDALFAMIREGRSFENGDKPDPARVEFLNKAMNQDRGQIAEVLMHECLQRPDTEMKLRTRKGVGDVFAILSPAYTTADAPEVVAQLVDGLPADARGTWSYDPVSTAWELRAHVWTPTPVAEQAVGEAFEGYGSFQGRDNGTARFRGGGGATFIRCLNASTYMADGAESARVHRANVLVDVEAMLKVALSSIDALCTAWGTSRKADLAVPAKVTINDAIPGFWRYLLTDRRSELAGVLPGRSEKHVELLTKAFDSERRYGDRLARSDLAQGWTRYVQAQPTPVRRQAEQAIGDWLVNGRNVGCVLNEEV